MIQEAYNSPFVTKADFDSLKKTTEDGFILVDDKLIKTDKKFDYMTEAMMGNFDRVYVRFDEVERKFDYMTEAMMGNFDRVYERFDKIDDKFDKLDAGFNELKNDLSLIKKHLGIKDATISA